MKRILAIQKHLESFEKDTLIPTEVRMNIVSAEVYILRAIIDWENLEKRNNNWENKNGYSKREIKRRDHF